MRIADHGTYYAGESLRLHGIRGAAHPSCIGGRFDRLLHNGPGLHLRSSGISTVDTRPSRCLAFDIVA